MRIKIQTAHNIDIDTQHTAAVLCALEKLEAVEHIDDDEEAEIVFSRISFECANNYESEE